MGSVGILVTCDSGRERRALEEVTTLLDEVGQLVLGLLNTMCYHSVI